MCYKLSMPGPLYWCKLQMNFGMHAFGRVGLTRYNYSKLIELTQVSLSSSYLRRVDVIQALHAEDSTNG